MDFGEETKGVVRDDDGSSVIVGGGCPDDRSYFETVLRTEGYQVQLIETPDEAPGELKNCGRPCLVLWDWAESGVRATELLRKLRRSCGDVPMILTHGGRASRSLEAAAEEERVHVLEKPFLPEELLAAVARGLGFSRERASTAPALVARPEVPPPTYMQRIERLIVQAGRSDVPVLLQGETGVGKEVLARQIHVRSNRSQNQFVKINCAALPTELVESELFGFEKGSFSGAFQQRQGLFESAHQGTILLDEIGDMDVSLQAKLLQVLQDGEFRRLGGRNLIRVDIRVMAATHQDLRRAIEEGRFREDLYYRLNVVGFKIPPLRERRTEIPALAEYFLRKHEMDPGESLTIPSFLEEAMLTYNWPGNVRELENAMRRYIVMRDPFLLAEEWKAAPCPKLLPAGGRIAVMPGEPANESRAFDALMRAEEVQKLTEREALLNIDYKAFLYRMKKLGVGPEREGQKRRPSGAAGKPGEPVLGNAAAGA